ncbi:MAG: LPS-assembly protein LptD [Myxococcales bacterium]|nr:LPS-assembly protein LptD [Myxococcales bacterium]
MKHCRWLVILLLLLPCVAWAQAGDDPRGGSDETKKHTDDEPVADDPNARSITPFLQNVLKSDEPITLEADRVEYDAFQSIYRASGNAVLKQGDNTLQAANVVLDLTAKLLHADGGISLSAPDGGFQADALDLALESETAVIARASFVIIRNDVNYYLHGRRIEKVGPDRYLIYEGNYTTCDCGPDEADWLVTADFIDVTFDGYAIVERGRVYLQGLPVAYLPYGIFPAKVRRSTGFLWPATGWASDDGYRIGLPFYWNIADHADATLNTDWYENRGTKLGLDYRYLMNKRWYGEANVDYIQDHLENDESRWSIGYEQRFNPAKQLYLRNQISLISDNDYVNDFPHDVSARYDRFIRSDVIVNNLWQNYDLNVAAQYWKTLTSEDNSYTWQHYPQASFDAVSQQIGPIPLYWRSQAIATNFYRPKISPTEKDLDELTGNSHSYYFLTDGRRFTVLPELHSPLNFNQVLTLTPYALGEGTFYQLNDRLADRTVSRATGEVGARLYTRFERPYTVSLPVMRGLKHQIEPAVEYKYRDEPDQDKLPVFDGEDRLPRLSAIAYGLTNRLWMRLFSARDKSFHTFKLTDFRVLHGYDFAEAERALDPTVENDERRPWQPWRLELETLGSAGSYLSQILVRGDLEYDTYQDDVTRFDIMGLLGNSRDDAIGAEYRYHVDEAGEVDIQYLSGLARYNLLDVLSFDYLTRYSFIDSYFIETRYGIEVHSLEKCWSVRLNIEQREIPEKETVFIVMTDLTGLVQAGTAF